MKVQYQEYQPAGFLHHFVHCFWQYENLGRENSHTILPDGFFELIIESQAGELKNISLTGIWTKPINVTVPEKTSLFAIRFKLPAAEYLFQKKIDNLLNDSETLPIDFWNLKSSVNGDFEDFRVNLSRQLKSSLKLLKLKDTDTRKLNLFELIYKNKFGSVEQLSQEIVWSSRQINRYFNRQFGLSVKGFQKIIRCASAYRLISQGLLSPPADFFDQSHFIKEIKHYTGTTPRRLYQNKNDRFLQLSTIE